MYCRSLIRFLSAGCLSFKAHPIERLVSHDCARACKYMHTAAPGPFLGGCFLFTPFPPLFTRGFYGYPPLLPPDGSHPSESSTASGTAHRAESNSLVTPPGVLFRLEGRPMGLADNRSGR